MSDAESEPSYSFRRHALAGARRLRLGSDAVLWEDAHRKGNIAYADVRTVRLYDLYRPYGFFPLNRLRVRRCVLESGTGSDLLLQSADYDRWGRPTDRSGAYVPFVRDLIGRIAAASPQASFVGGLPRRSSIGYAISLVLMPLLLVAVIVNVAFWDGDTVVLLILLWLVPAVWLAAWTSLRRGRQRRLDLRDPSEDVFGPEGSNS